MISPRRASTAATRPLIAPPLAGRAGPPASRRRPPSARLAPPVRRDPRPQVAPHAVELRDRRAERVEVAGVHGRQPAAHQPAAHRLDRQGFAHVGCALGEAFDPHPQWLARRLRRKAGCPLPRLEEDALDLDPVAGLTATVGPRRG